MKRENLEESNEKLPSVDNKAPSSKYQSSQQVQNSDVPMQKGFAGTGNADGAAAFVPKKSKVPGSRLKQEVAASVVKDAQYGGSNAGDGLTFAGRAVSGGTNTVLGGASSTPTGGQARSDSRIGKKLDRNTTKLNFIPPDQILVEYDESKPLADSSNEDQGFNGTYRNEYARTQKKSENVPGALMFDRSLDILSRDHVYDGQGQVVKQKRIRYDDAVTKTAVRNELNIYVNPEVDNYTAGKTGNFITHSMDIAFTPSGRPAFMAFNESEYTPEVDADTANRSSAAFKIRMNDAELVRESIDSKAGDEKAEIWCCLARAVAQPTQTCGFLRDIEADTGNELLTAYRKASTGFSFQLNRAHKDGQDTVIPGVEYLVGLNDAFVNKDDYISKYGKSDLKKCFTKAQYKRGDGSTIIALYDSIDKYNTKADLLVQPRGPRMHLQTADNNLDPFYVDKRFVQMYDEREVFSTIDREYDPMLPICMSDKATVKHAHSWNALGGFYYPEYKLKLNGNTAYSSSALDNMTILPESVVSLFGEDDYIHVYYPHEAAGSITYEAAGVLKRSKDYEFQTGKSLVIKITSSDTPVNIDGFDVVTISMASMFDANYPIVLTNTTANVSFDEANGDKSYAAFGGPFRYVFSDLRSKYVTRVAHPLLEGLNDYFEQLIGGKYYTLTSGELVNIPTFHSTKFLSLWSFLLCAATPFIGKARINSMRDVLYYEKNVEYPFGNMLVSLRDVLTKAYSNFGYSDYDHELEVKSMLPSSAISWILPEVFTQVGASGSDKIIMMPYYACENDYLVDRETNLVQYNGDSATMCFPSIRSGARFAALDSLYSMTEKDVRLSIDRVSNFLVDYGIPVSTNGLCYSYKYSQVSDGQVVFGISGDITGANILQLPRELGYFQVAPYGLLTPSYEGIRSDHVSNIDATSYRATYWTGTNPVVNQYEKGAEHQSILLDTAMNVDRGQNFMTTWYTVLASGTTPPVDHGFALSVNQLIDDKGEFIYGRSTFTPFVSALSGRAADTNNFIPVMSIQKAMWTRIQKLPFIISPFDLRRKTSNSGCNPDIYDMMYWFGLAGFRASDYRESVYNREKEVVNQGILFVSDPWVEASPIFKEGAITSGISVAKGFEV